MACDPLITDRFVFPRRANNRPGPAAHRLPHRPLCRLRRGDAARHRRALPTRGVDPPRAPTIRAIALLRGRGDPRRHPDASTRSTTPTRPTCARPRWRESVADWCGSPAIGWRPASAAAPPWRSRCAARKPVTIREGLRRSRPISQDVPDAGRLPDRRRARSRGRIWAASTCTARASIRHSLPPARRDSSWPPSTARPIRSASRPSI